MTAPTVAGRMPTSIPSTSQLVEALPRRMPWTVTWEWDNGVTGGLPCFTRAQAERIGRETLAMAQGLFAGTSCRVAVAGPDGALVDLDQAPGDELGDVRRCRVCWCTDDAACWPTCWWSEADLCSACVSEACS